MGSAELTERDMLWLVGSMATAFRVPFDATLVGREFPPPHSRTSLESALRSLGFRTGNLKLNGQAPTATSIPFPAIAFPREVVVQSTDAPDSPSDMRPSLVLKSDGSKILLFKTGSDKPYTIPHDQLNALFSELMPVARESAETDEVGQAAMGPDLAKAKPFGFSWFIPELLKHKTIWKEVLSASLVIQLIGLTTPLFTQVIIDKVVVHQTHSTLAVVGFGLVMFMVFNGVMTWLRQYLVIHTGNRIDAVLGSKVFRHLFRLPLPYYERRPTGVMVARMQGVETIREFITGAAVSLILDLPFLLIFLVVMFIYSWQLSLIALVILALITALSAVVSPLFRERLNKQFMLGARNQAFLTEYISGAETVKSLQMEPVLENRYGDYLAGYLSSSFSTRQLSSTYNVLAHTLEQTLTLSILVIGALLVMDNAGFTIGMLVAFQMFASRMTQPLLRLVGLWTEFQQASIAVKRLGDILDAPTEPYSLIPARAQEGNGKIELQDLSFRYSDQHPWLFRHLNYSFKPGALTLILGPSGCGKSTLAKMLQGFYQAADGQIRIDGVDIRHLSANELRSLFGIVPQETRLFSGTLYDNLLLANPMATFEEITKVCKQAEIHDFIQALPQGYQSPVGEHGVGLSGGQKQRIAIARGLLKNPKILIFDEATSSLDAQTAEAISRTIVSLKGDRTILFISHIQPANLIPDARLIFGAKPVPSKVEGPVTPIRQEIQRGAE